MAEERAKKGDNNDIVEPLNKQNLELPPPRPRQDVLLLEIIHLLYYDGFYFVFKCKLAEKNHKIIDSV